MEITHFLAVILFIFLVSCGSDQNEDLMGNGPNGTAKVIFANASPDSQPLNISIGNTEIISGLDFRENTSYQTIETTDNVAKITIAGGDIFIEEDLTFGGDYNTVFIANTATDIGVILTEDKIMETTMDGSGELNVAIRFINLSPGSVPLSLTSSVGNVISPNFEGIGFGTIPDYATLGSARGGNVLWEVRITSSRDIVFLVNTQVRVSSGSAFTGYVSGFPEGVPQPDITWINHTDEQ